MKKENNFCEICIGFTMVVCRFNSYRDFANDGVNIIIFILFSVAHSRQISNETG